MHTPLSDVRPANSYLIAGIPVTLCDLCVRQVQQLFPHVSLSAITEDLQQSGSIEATVENILEGSVHDHPAPPMFTSDEPADDGRGWSRPGAGGEDGDAAGKRYQHDTRLVTGAIPVWQVC